jgi:hypothetical protein
MTGNASDAQIDRLVKAGWLKMGLSPRDLAEVLDAVLRPRAKQDGDEGLVGADRLTEIGHALDMPIDAVRAKGPAAGPPEAPLSPVDVPLSVLSLLELRLLRAFCQLQDPRTRQLLIHLAEQIVKRQSDCGGDAA